jgi:hypothetical protein
VRDWAGTIDRLLIISTFQSQRNTSRTPVVFLDHCYVYPTVAAAVLKGSAFHHGAHVMDRSDVE